MDTQDSQLADIDYSSQSSHRSSLTCLRNSWQSLMVSFFFIVFYLMPLIIRVKVFYWSTSILVVIIMAMGLHQHSGPRSSLTLLLLVACLVGCVKCSYTKVQYLQVGIPITSIITCKSSSNVIYTTSDNLLNYWTSYEKVSSYSLASNARSFQLSCSKYSSRMDHAYFSVLDSAGILFIWEEVVRNFFVGLEARDFTLQRPAPISQASVGQESVALAYKALNIVDIYNLNDNTRTHVLTFNDTVHTIKLDSFGCLITVLQSNEGFRLIYDDIPNQVRLVTGLPFSNSTRKVTLDYEEARESDAFKLKIMVANGSDLGFVYLSQSKQLSPYSQRFQSVKLAKLCDGQVAYTTESTPQQLDKQLDGNVMVLNSAVLLYDCSTDTGSYIYSQFFAVSEYDNLYFIDCYYSANQLLAYLIGFGTFCCCFCLRLCANMAGRGLRCRELGGCLVFTYSMLCWCPTRDNMDEIEEKLQR